MERWLNVSNLRIDLVYYSRLFTTVRQIYTSQPVAPRHSLELLARFIVDAEAIVNAVEATISEIGRDLNLL